MIIPVELIHAHRYEHDSSFAEEYALRVLADIVSLKKGDVLQSVEFPLGSRILKVNTLLDIDGFRANITCKDSGGKYFGISPAISLLVCNKDTVYIKRLLSVHERIVSCEKNKTVYHIKPEFDVITKERNLEIYDMLCNKINASPFCVILSNIGSTFNNGRTKFMTHELNDQVKALVNMIAVLKDGLPASAISS